MQKIELLSPAKDLATGLAAINCGADAVYLGAARFGAREAAGNSLADVEQLIQYAHRYWAKVYVVVNTLLRDAEIDEALKLIRQVYQAGADALIIQDPGLLECDLPPLPLFASTQMHNHSPERVAFLEQVGFRRAILARELSLEQIRAIRAQTTLELESFIHGALCVCYSGQCYLSYANGGRSGNRGQCAQPCRQAYALLDAAGQTLGRDRHWLSIRDLNLTGHLGELLAAGVTSFKIEGRLKDANYVKNVVGHYRRALDTLLTETGRAKSSSGEVSLGFEPQVEKTFNRGYSTYFLNGRGDRLEANASPKMVGEPLGKISTLGRNSFTLASSTLLQNGDGLTFFNRAGQLQGTSVNRVDGKFIYPAKMDGLEPGLELFRNHDHVFLNQLEKSLNERKIGLGALLAETVTGYRLAFRDFDGIQAEASIPSEKIAAQKPEVALATIEKQIGKLGESEFALKSLRVEVQPVPFIPVAALNELRRLAVEALRAARAAARPVERSEFLPNGVPFPERELTYQGNVLNRRAAAFYRRHGVTKIEPAAEAGLNLHGRTVMTTKYCVKYQLGHCPREGQPPLENEPLTLVAESGQRLRLKFDCKACQMEVIYE
jgi:collagenase-like PrtC family protease